MEKPHTCTECGHTFDAADWWACTTCEAPTPDLLAEREKQKIHPTRLGVTRGRRRVKKQPDVGDLRELLF